MSSIYGEWLMRSFDDFCSVFKRRANAVAFINGSDEYPTVHGRVLFYQVRDGVIVRAEITGLPSKAGSCSEPVFAFHIHSGTECSGNAADAFANANGHYDPNDCPHPYHAGDMPSLFGVNGRAFSVFLTDRFTVPQILGRTMIVHALPDDFTTQPSGNAGEKIACGVITPTAR